MAIINGSDLLVYKKNTDNVKQITKITIVKDVPLNETNNAAVKITNLFQSNGNAQNDQSINVGTNTANALGTALKNRFDTLHSTVNAYQDVTYDSSTRTLTVTNTFAGELASVINVVDNASTLVDGAISIVVLTEGATEQTLEPVAFSTNATISITRDLRDITNKDSGGVSESLPGQKSFEITVDALEDLTADYELQSKIDELLDGDKVEIMFSQRLTSGNDVCVSGKAFVSSITANAGVEENLTYSATFTGTDSFARTQV